MRNDLFWRQTHPMPHFTDWNEPGQALQRLRQGLADVFVLFHQRVCGALANSLVNHRPDESLKPASRIEAAYPKADRAIQNVLDQLAA